MVGNLEKQDTLENTLIEVKQEDIDGGVCGKPKRCMLALAINRVLKGGYFAVVARAHFYIHSVEDFRYCANHHQELMTLKFDEKQKIEPYSFMLDLPKDILNGDSSH